MTPGILVDIHIHDPDILYQVSGVGDQHWVLQVFWVIIILPKVWKPLLYRVTCMGIVKSHQYSLRKDPSPGTVNLPFSFSFSAQGECCFPGFWKVGMLFEIRVMKFFEPLPR